MSLAKKWLVIIIGPPGAGKGTQGDMLAQQFNLVHFETSKVIEEKINSADLSDELLMAQKKLWQSGELVDPELVVKWTIEKISEIAKNGFGMVMSGSPRTMHEAKEEAHIFEELYGKENVKIIHLNLSKEESVKRNSSRRICQANRHPVPDFPMFRDITTCPKDGSPLLKRELDTPETIKIRYEVYLRRTQPILSFLESYGYKIIEIEGEKTIEEVYNDILRAVGE